jgi:hypothetical protein
MAALPDDPPRSMETPFSMPDPNAVRDLVASAGFRDARVETVELMGEAVSAAHLAFGLVRGNPLAGQLTARGIDAEALMTRVREALVREFGDRPCRAALSAHVVTALA